MGITNQVKINLYYLLIYRILKVTLISLKAFKGLSFRQNINVIK